jgi:hypothetical protein
VWACRIVGRRDLVIEVDISVGLLKWRGLVGGMCGSVPFSI